MRTWHKTLILTGLWLAISVVWGTYFFAQSASQGIATPYIRHLVAAFTVFSFWLLITPLIGRLATRFPIRTGQRLRHIGFHLLIAPVIFLVHMGWLGLVAPLTFSALGWDTWSGYWSHQTLTSFLVNLRGPVDVALYWGLVLAFTAADYYSMVQQESLRAARLESELLEAQLVHLRSQLQPHFLFNTLHSLVALIQSDCKEDAIRVAVGLGDLLRKMVTESDRHETTLREEIKLVSTYIELEQIRFHDRLTVTYDISEEVEPAYVPSLFLQPITDNAIRHGVGRRLGPASIRISARRDHDNLIVRVEDCVKGHPVGSNQSGMGIGLTNTRKRLEHLYGQRWSVAISDLDGAGSVVTIVIPFSQVPQYTGTGGS